MTVSTEEQERTGVGAAERELWWEWWGWKAANGFNPTFRQAELLERCAILVARAFPAYMAEGLLDFPEEGPPL